MEQIRQRMKEAGLSDAQLDDVCGVVSPAIAKSDAVVKERLTQTPIEQALRERMTECAWALRQIRRNLKGIPVQYNCWTLDLETWANKLEKE